MLQRNMLLCRLVLFIQVYFSSTNGQGFRGLQVLQSAAERHETRLANGTVIGQYALADARGAPVLVRYYADEDGYGLTVQRRKPGSPEPGAAAKPKTKLPVVLNPFDPYAEIMDKITRIETSLMAKPAKDDFDVYVSAGNDLNIVPMVNDNQERLANNETTEFRLP